MTTDTLGLMFDTKGLDDRTARSSVGPGAVNLMTGNFAVTEVVVDIASGVAGLRVNRTYNSRDATTSGPLGPGWKLAAPVSDGVDAVGTITEHLDAGYVELTLGDGTIIPFGVGRTEHGHALYRTPAGYERFSLTKRPDTSTLPAVVDWEYLLTDETTGASTVLRTTVAVATTYWPEVIKVGPTGAALTAVRVDPATRPRCADRWLESVAQGSW